MSDDIYVKLRDKLNQLGVGFAPTEAGYEFTFLKRFFTPEDAEYFLEMNDDFQTPAEFAAQTGKDIDVKDMSKRGLIFRLRRNEEVSYHIIPVAHGVYEFNVDKLDPGWMTDFNNHMGAGWGPQFYGTDTPLFRTIPVNSSIVAESKILPIDDAESIIRSKKYFAVSPCCCRLAARMGETSCTHTLETCMVFDDFAKYYVENGIAREISMDEALQIARSGEKDGRITQIYNSKNVEVMCSCCSCCCGILALAKALPGPANEVISNYYCQVDESLCAEGCADICVGRCPFNARQIIDGNLQFDQRKCAGCGLCVTACPTKALSLIRKDDEHIYEPPDTYFDTNKAMERYRNKI